MMSAARHWYRWFDAGIRPLSGRWLLLATTVVAVVAIGGLHRFVLTGHVGQLDQQIRAATEALAQARSTDGHFQKLVDSRPPVLTSALDQAERLSMLLASSGSVSAEVRIGEQRSLKPGNQADLDELSILVNRLTLKAGLPHDGPLLPLLSQIDQQAGSLLAVRECRVTRHHETMTPVSADATALVLDCALDIHDLLDGMDRHCRATPRLCPLN